MKIFVKILTAICLAVALFSNCAVAAGENVAQKSASGKPKKQVLPLAQKLPPLPPKPKPKPVPPNRVLVRVNGIDITRAKLDRHVDFMVVLLKNKNPKVTPEKVKSFKARNLKRFSNELLLKTMLTTCLAESNVIVSAEMRQNIERDFAKNYGKKKQSYAQIRDVVEHAGFSRELEESLAFESRFKTFVTTIYSNRYYVTDAQVKKYRERVENFNKVAMATNEVNRALAQKALARVNSGENFAKLADELSQDPEKQPGGLVGQCDEHDFEDAKQVWMAVSSLKVGGVTGVIDLEDGFAIYRVNARKSAEESESGAEALELSRIFFRRAFMFPAQSDEDFRADIEKELRATLFNDIVKAFRAQSKVEYPEGITKTY